MVQLVAAFAASRRRVRRPRQESSRGKPGFGSGAFAAWLVSAIVGALLPAWVSVAAEVSEVAKLLASDGAAGDRFGISVAVSGDTAVVGAYQDYHNGSQSGSAYVFRYDETAWVEEAKLLALDRSSGDEFGWSVAIAGDVAVVGAYGDDDNGSRTGAAYVFRYVGTAWVQEGKLKASDGTTEDRFGWSVAVAGDTAVVGAYGDDDFGTSSGAAYVFRHVGTAWVQEAKLIASDAAVNGFVGWSVAVAGSKAVVGSIGDGENGSNAGAAYVFRDDGSAWVEEMKLLALDGEANDFLGASVGIAGDTVVVGAPSEDTNGSNSGSAYVFRFDETDWVEEAKLTASNGAADDRFGWSVAVAVAGDQAVVGSIGGGENGSSSGAAYVFRDNGGAWVEEPKLLASDGAAGDQLGVSVAIAGDAIVVGADRDDDSGSLSGSAYVFPVPEPSVGALHATALAALAGLARRGRRRTGCDRSLRATRVSARVRRAR